MDRFAFIMFLIWIVIIIGAFAAHIYYGVPAYENVNTSVWVDSFGYDGMVHDNSFDCVVA